MFKSSQKGVSLFLTIIMLSIILTIVFGLSTILISQLKIIQKMGDSVLVFYVANTGIEKAMKPALDYAKDELDLPDSGTLPVDDYSGSFDFNGGGTAYYDIEIVCCDSSIFPDNCLFSGSRTCDLPLNVDPNCQADFFCIKVIGEYKGTKRAIEAEIFPF